MFDFVKHIIVLQSLDRLIIVLTIRKDDDNMSSFLFICLRLHVTSYEKCFPLK